MAVLAVVATCLFAATAVAQTYDVLRAFSSTGLSPYAGLIQATDGNLYGTTHLGGAYGYGTVFKTDTNGSTFTTLHSFAGSDGAYPHEGLIQGTDGNLYGTTNSGGPNVYGTIFKIDTSGATFTTLHSFANSDGANPWAGLIQGTDGNLYGTTNGGGGGGYGTIFKIDTNGSTLTTLHSFAGYPSDGANPYAGLIQGSDGNLYGTTIGGGANIYYGTIFKIDTSGSTLTTLHSFALSDGAYPYAGLIQGRDGNLYGTTYQGGTSGWGTIFKIDTSGATFTTLHSFANSDGAYAWAGLIQGSDGNLYGTTIGGGGGGYGAIFKIDTSGSTLTTLHSFALSDGAYPYAGLIQATDGNLYGTTWGGGASGYGTIFRIDTNGTNFATLRNFAPYSDGRNPYARLIQGRDGSLYGTTFYGGANGCVPPLGCGAIFKIDTNGSTLTTLHSFAGYPSDGANPYAGLIQGSDGNLYGTAANGGPTGNEYGTIFKIDTNGSMFTTLHSFYGSADGAYPHAALIQGSDGSLYGTTAGGGLSGSLGTIFKIDTNGSTFTTLHSFALSDGAYPWAGLIQGTDGNLYGTARGGPNGYGTVFKIGIDGSGFVTLHSFSGSDGSGPSGSLIQGTDGNLYGTMSNGGVSGYGTIFKIDTNGSTFTTLHNFSGSDGAGPNHLIQGSDGNLYGTTNSGGPNVYGTIFKIDTNGSTLTTLHSFAGYPSDGANPYAGLIQGSDKSLYGTASLGGPEPASQGVVFRLTLAFFVADVVPNSGPSSGGTAVSITGLGFESTDTVSIGGAAATGVSLVSPSQIDATTPALSPGTLNDLVVTKLDLSRDQLLKAFLADFRDVSQSDSFHAYVEKIFRNGITAGIGGGYYGRDNPVTRAQMAVFLLRAEHGSTYVPPTCTAPGIFGDVPCPAGFAADWIEQLYREGITGGCSSSPLLYCPDDSVTRAQMAVFLLRGEHGSSYRPPTCTAPGTFGDVPCPGAFAVDWIERLYAEGVTGGCSASPLLYCPGDPNTRGQMAVFLTKTFNLP